MKEFTYVDENFQRLQSKNGVIEFDPQLREKFNFITEELYAKYERIISLNTFEERINKMSNYKWDYIKVYLTLEILDTSGKYGTNSFLISNEIFSLMKYCSIKWLETPNYSTSFLPPHQHISNIRIPYVMYSKEKIVEPSYKFDLFI